MAGLSGEEGKGSEPEWFGDGEQNCSIVFDFFSCPISPDITARHQPPAYGHPVPGPDEKQTI